MKQETCLRKFATSMIAAAMILITLLNGLPAFDAFVGEVSAGGGNFAGGDGTADNPYQIEDVLDLQNMSADLNAHYVLVNDIDASATRDWNDGNGFDPVGGSLNKFTGILCGQGHKITGLFVNRAWENYVGLFGYVGTGGSVSNISLVNVHISGRRYVGGLVGWNEYGTVGNSYATGTITGISYVGGLVGSNDYYGTVENSSATGTVSGNDYVGGLVGRNYRTVQNSFWDIEASGTTTSAGGTGKNTTEMMKWSTFTDAGWDFNDTWNIIEGKSYPYLRAFPKDPTKWEEEKESNGDESFLSQKIGPLPLYAYLVFVIIGIVAGAGALIMKGGKSGGEAQKPEQSQ